METRALEKSLTENIIKKVALRFFRNYYKFRLRYEDQPVVAKYDLEGVGGIIADGYYSFKKTDGRPFIATFEATSQESKDEVIYKPQKTILFWDGVVFASLATLVLVSLNYFNEFHLLDDRTLWLRLVLLLAVAGISFFSFYFLARNFRRYRYIYAVEQFKKYHADEQWITLADDVFENSSDKYFRELKNQCIYNGFGLLLVNEKLDTKILVTPSRQDIFMGKRRTVAFLPQSETQQQKIQQQFGIKWALLSWLPDYLKPDATILRFRKTFYTQMAMAGGCLFLIGLIFLRELQESGYQIVDEAEYRQEIAKSKSNAVPEQEEYLGDSAMTTNSRNLELEAFNRNIWEQPKTKVPELRPVPQPALPARPVAPKDTTEIMVNSGSEKSIAYDCARFFTFTSDKYIIEEGIYDRWPAAENRLNVLRRNGIPSAALLLQCFSSFEEGYVIYIGEIYNSPEEASQEIEALDQVPQSILKNYRQLKIRTVHPARR